MIVALGKMGVCLHIVIRGCLRILGVTVACWSVSITVLDAIISSTSIVLRRVASGPVLPVIGVLTMMAVVRILKKRIRV
jgi:hypothetical protein